MKILVILNYAFTIINILKPVHSAKRMEIVIKDNIGKIKKKVLESCCLEMVTFIKDNSVEELWQGKEE